MDDRRVVLLPARGTDGSPTPREPVVAEVMWLQWQRWPVKPRHGAVAAALLVALGAVPGSLLATLSSMSGPAAPGLEAEYARLGEVRELLEQQQALRDSLTSRVDALAGEIENLRQRRETVRAMALRERDEAGRLERRLDRLVPRYLERAAAVDARRERAAQALADLASMSRQAELDSTIRARMLAISPLMLDRLRTAETGLAAQRRSSERTTEHHRDLEARSPALLAERQRLELIREQRQRQQRAELRRLEQLDAGVARLRDEEQRLAGRVLQVENAYLARAEPGADEPALIDAVVIGGGSRVTDARVKGATERRVSPGVAARAVQPASSKVVARVSHDRFELVQPEIKVHAELPALPPPPAKPMNVALKGDVTARSLGASLDATNVVSPLDVVFHAPTSLTVKPNLASTRRNRHARAPIMPIAGEIIDRGRPEITILAAEGQPVAAPDSGKIAFAGWFRSYGLLLIIEHSNDYHTLLWGFGRLEVEAGDHVDMGQIVGFMGATDGRPPELYVEIRQNGRPVNPMQWLAASSSKVRG
jgi:murein DD-endopeptidase MepM/ murein hydrolase activator NlpD